MSSDRAPTRPARPFLRILALMTGLLVTAFVSGAVRAALGSPDEAPAVSADPAALVSLSRSVPSDPGDPIQILLDETHLQFDAAGHLTRTEHFIYRIDSEDRPSDWAETAISWSPWFQERPRLDAQVIARDGQTHRLDPSTITEAPVPGDRADTYTDQRILKAPLPAVAEGSIIEEVQTVRDTAVVIDAGLTMRLSMGRSVPVRTRRIVVELPADLPFQYRLEKVSGVNVERSTLDGRQRILFTAERQARFGDLEIGEPYDVPRYPAVVISTGSTWSRLVEEYRKLSEGQISGDPGRGRVHELAQGIVSGHEQSGQRELIEKAVRRLHREVRYTGVELGQATIRPACPSETLKRRYGDCKDKSLLLVALLRELGISAELALLNTGPGQDLIPEMPGWGVFDHAIVHVPGPSELWIDATDSFSRVGQLSFEDQGRLALRMAPDVTELDTIPLAGPSENRIIEMREFFLSESDPVRVVETSDLVGAPEALYRQLYGQSMKQSLQSSMEAYARGTYMAHGAVTATTTGADDFAQPFRLVVTALDARSGYANLEEAGVVIPWLGLFDRLPDVLTAFDPDSIANPAYTGQRKSELIVQIPTVMEWRYRIVPPPGYRPDPVPGRLDLAFGPMTYHQEFAAESSGVVAGTLIMDPVVTRLSPADVRAFRNALADVRSASILAVTFHHEGLSLIDEGRLSEAIRWLQEDVRRAPKSATARMRLSRGLLAAGLGEPARAEARQAVRLAPEKSTSYGNLAHVLSHDLLGRGFRRGFDREGAIEAYRKAIDLDPEDKSLVIGLAILNEFDATAERYGRGSNLEESIRLYKGLTEEEIEQAGVEGNLPVALMESGRYAELEEWAQGPRDLKALAALKLIAVAAQRGGAAAIAEANRSTSDDGMRSQALLTAGSELVLMRRYADAASLIQAGSRGQENAAAQLARAEFLSRIRQYDPAAAPPSDPRALCLLFCSRAFDEAMPIDSLTALVSMRTKQQLSAEENRESLESMRRLLRRSLRQMNLSPENLVDILASQAVDLRVEGDSTTGCRIRTAMLGSAGQQAFYVKREGERWVLVDTSVLGENTPDEAIGLEAADLLRQRNMAGARQWLEWAKEFLPAATIDSLGSHPFHQFYRGGEDLERLKLAAATLLASGSEESGRLAIDLLDEAKVPKRTAQEAQAEDLVRGLAYLSSGRPDSALALASRLRARQPRSLLCFGLEISACSDLGDAAEARRRAEARLQMIPDDENALHVLLELCGLQGDMAGVARCGRRLDATQHTGSLDLNNWAWYDLMAGTVTDSTVERINRAILLGQMSNSGAARFSVLHTQASIYAELNRTAEARDILYQAMDLQGLEEPDEDCWYVLGRLAEQYGLKGAARDAYRRIRPSTERFGVQRTVYQLAQQRLKGLPS